MNLWIVYFCFYSRAKLLLKKKRYQEQLVEKTDKQLDLGMLFSCFISKLSFYVFQTYFCILVEQLVHDLEFAQVEMQV